MAIYNSNSDFNPTGINDVSYVPGASNMASLSIESLVNASNEYLKQEKETLKDIEKRVLAYKSSADTFFNLRYDNEHQRDVLESVRNKYNAGDSFINSIDFNDLKSGVKVAQLQESAKAIMNDYQVKQIMSKQKKGDEFLAESDAVYAVNPALGLLAKKAYLDKYASQKEEDYLGFPLDISEYKPIDVLGEIDGLIKDIPDEFDLEVDPNSPDGYYFIDKVSQKPLFKTEVKAIMEKKVMQKMGNPNFNNNVKALIGANGGDINDPNAIKSYINSYLDNVNYKKVVESIVKEIPKQTYANSSGSSSGSLSDERTADQKNMQIVYDYIDSQYPGYNSSSLDPTTAHRLAKGDAVSPSYTETPDGLLIEFFNTNDRDKEPIKTKVLLKKKDNVSSAVSGSGNSSGYVPNIKGFVPANEDIKWTDIDFDVIGKVETGGQNIVHYDEHENPVAIGEYGLDFDNAKKMLGLQKNTPNAQVINIWNNKSSDPSFKNLQKQWMYENLHKPIIDFAKAEMPSMDNSVLNYVADIAHNHSPETAKKIIRSAMDSVKKEGRAKYPLSVLNALDRERIKAIDPKRTDIDGLENRIQTVYDSSFSKASQKALDLERLKFKFKSGANTDEVDPMDLDQNMITAMTYLQNEFIKKYNSFGDIIVSSTKRSNENYHSKKNKGSMHPKGGAIDISIKTKGGKDLANLLMNLPENSPIFKYLDNPPMVHGEPRWIHGTGENQHLHIELRRDMLSSSDAPNKESVVTDADIMKADSLSGVGTNKNIYGNN